MTLTEVKTISTRKKKNPLMLLQKTHGADMELGTCSRWYRAADILCTRSTFLSGSVGSSLFKMSLYRFNCHFTAGSSDWKPTYVVCKQLNEDTEFEQHRCHSHSVIENDRATPLPRPLLVQTNICWLLRRTALDSIYCWVTELNSWARFCIFISRNQLKHPGTSVSLKNNGSTVSAGIEFNSLQNLLVYQKWKRVTPFMFKDFRQCSKLVIICWVMSVLTVYSVPK